MPGLQRQQPKVPHWCTRFGGALSLPLVGLAVLIAIFTCALLVLAAQSLLPENIRSVRTEIYAFSLVCVLLSLWLLVGPVFAYVNIGQAKKIELIRGYYSPDLIGRYFDQFWQGRDGFAKLVGRWRMERPQLSDLLQKDLEAEFVGLFRDDFGQSVYIIPSILLVAIASIVLFFGFCGRHRPRGGAVDGR